jgi:hypothetical protein
MDLEKTFNHREPRGKSFDMKIDCRGRGDKIREYFVFSAHSASSAVKEFAGLG